jgi:hypothetical protein
MSKTPDAARFTVEHSPTTPLRNLIGLGDFADASGLSYDTITAYRGRGYLPAPAAMLGRVPVWTKRQLKVWLEERAKSAAVAAARAAVGGSQ